MIGETLGQYRIVDLIGHGGMAAVYVGEHVMVRHRVAIKVVHPRHLDSPRMAQRFLNEARAVAAIRHPGIVEFYDLGRADDGRAYIVMELLAGETIASRMRKGAIPVGQAISYARQMASALGAAHECGIVHRDLKPANVFLVPDPDVRFGERAKILDFGIAKHTEDREELTGAGVLVGTPAHMSPEQCKGERIDGRSDVYALGILLYHMVTGREPFDEGTTGEIVTRQICEDVLPASIVEPSVPVALSDVIARCMQKNRAHRFATMAAVADVLGGVAEAMDLGAGPSHEPAEWSTPIATPVAIADRPSHATLTRTIVQTPTWLGKVRNRIWKYAALAVGEIAVITVAVSLATMGDSETARATEAAPAAVEAAGVEPLACDDEIEMAADEPPRSARPPSRERRREETSRSERSEKAEKKAAKKEKEREPEKKEREPEKKAKPPAKAKAKAPKPQEDPFESIATPAVY